MLGRIILIILAVALSVNLMGCASAKKRELENQGLRNQINALEAQLQSKDDEIAGLKDSLTKAEEAQIQERAAKGKNIPEVKSRPKAKQIQVALRNAGFYDGVIDGKLGQKSRQAIEAFQKANNLKADGKVGKETWAVLSRYMIQKIK